MGWHVWAIGCAGGILVVALWLSFKNGSQAAQLAALKARLRKNAEEQQHAEQIKNNVYAMSADDARRRLHDVANKQH